MALKPHHAAWLAAHPHRSEQWLLDALRDGFDVHHLDGASQNNAPDNLLLIETSDHTQILHGLKMVRAIGCKPRESKRPLKHKRGRIVYELRRDKRLTWLALGVHAGCTPRQAERWAKRYAKVEGLAWPLTIEVCRWPAELDQYIR